MNVNTIQHGSHCVFNMHVHLVFVVKYRKKVFTKEILSHLEVVFTNVCTNLEAELIEFNGEQDHVHLLIKYPPKLSVALLVNRLKGTSSYLIHKRNYPSIRKKLWYASLWSPSYFAASCGGAPISILQQYINSQCSPH